MSVNFDLEAELSDVLLDVESELKREKECDKASYRRSSNRGGTRRCRAWKNRSHAEEGNFPVVDTDSVALSLSAQQCMDLDVGQVFEMELNDVGLRAEGEKEGKVGSNFPVPLPELSEHIGAASIPHRQSWPGTMVKEKDLEREKAIRVDEGTSSLFSQVVLMRIRNVHRRRSFVGRSA
uniref:Uncharacterized protein n=1 Tax=Pseudictyota dubia TaxID=2749911 RepID=A0A7R9ZBU4_9STRA|mmetsp:Transcript_348/g.415  ORF Transcript_348/g.415 Transcript_348/m.415 type:complete len:179 (+) Transcript_348:247-783(+)